MDAKHGIERKSFGFRDPVVKHVVTKFVSRSDIGYEKYGRTLDELLQNPDGRRATMVYNRPSIWEEYNEEGKSDFICTNAVTYYIRDDKLFAVVQMRSNDVVFGYKNDYAWQQYVLEELTRAYNYEYMMSAADADYRKDMKVGSITWQVQNLHVYEKHFDLIVPGPIPGPKVELSTAAGYEGYDNRNYG